MAMELDNSSIFTGNIEDLVCNLESSLHLLQNLAHPHKGKETCVVEGKEHIFVGLPLGINGTAFTVKCPNTCVHAVVFPSEKTAEEWGVDCHLMYSDGNTIENHPVNAGEFFEKAANECKDLLYFLKQQTNNTIETASAITKKAIK